MLNNFFQIFEFFHFFINVTEYHFSSPFLYQPLAEQQSAVAINLYTEFQITAKKFNLSDSKDVKITKG
nr:MAG TPA: hypothetical protein [Bacteriophage sp.]